MSVRRYRKGALSVPTLYADTIDTLSGDLTLKRAGSTHTVLGSSSLQASHNIVLAATKGIQDSGSNEILAGDGSGHIDGLGRIDDAITTPSGSHVVTITPSEVALATQSEVIDEDTGKWRADNTDILYAYLNTVFQYLMAQGVVYIETIEVNIYTTIPNDYLTSVTLEWFNATTGASIDSVADTTDVGNGTTGNETATLTVNTALVNNAYYNLQVSCVVGTSFVDVRSIKITYKLT